MCVSRTGLADKRQATSDKRQGISNLFLLLSLAFSAPTFATPQTVRVDGSIFDASGVPTTASKDIQIKAYDAASGGTLLWTSDVYTAVVNTARFTINMDAASGSSPSLVSQVGSRTSAQGIYFQVEVDSGVANGSMDSAQIVLPRIRAKGAMFALNAAEADSLRGVTATIAEMNRLAGVTAAIQTQINAISPMVASVVTGNTAATVNNAYFTSSASLVGVTLPATCAVGDRVKVAGVGTGGWKIVQQAGQSIDFSASSNSTASGSATTLGIGGYLKSIDAKAAVEIMCRVANTSWQVTASDGLYTGDYISGVSSYTANGTFVVPSNVRRITIKVWGAGGGGGAAGTATGGGGGGGAFASRLLSVNPGDKFTVLVGTGGALGGASGSGLGGGGGAYSGVKDGASYLVVAGGGGGGGSAGTNVAGTGGAGGGGVCTGNGNGTVGGNGSAGGVGGVPGGGVGGSDPNKGGGGGGAGVYGGGAGGGSTNNGSGGGGGGGGSSSGGFLSCADGSAGSGATGGAAGGNGDVHYSGSAGTGGNAGAAGGNGLVVFSF